MQVIKIIINNFRLLKHTEIDLEKEPFINYRKKIIVEKHRFSLLLQSFLVIRGTLIILIMMILI